MATAFLKCHAAPILGASAMLAMQPYGKGWPRGLQVSQTCNTRKIHILFRATPAFRNGLFAARPPKASESKCTVAISIRFGTEKSPRKIPIGKSRIHDRQEARCFWQRRRVGAYVQLGHDRICRDGGTD